MNGIRRNEPIAKWIDGMDNHALLNVFEAMVRVQNTIECTAEQKEAYDTMVYMMRDELERRMK